MKKLFLLLAIAGLMMQATAQKLMTKDVPAAVASAFNTAHPTVTDVEWRQTGANYEAEYDANKTDVYVTYDASGTLINTAVKISGSDIPANAMGYVKANYKEDEIRDASKITDVNGKVTYSGKVKGERLFFDSNGNFIRAEKKELPKSGK
ncbi:MAG: PepSY-like domain-containing protein [Bacteroidia bacterium]|nr:PepSY-like domain-containing protein [Bacteroidia bacterium]